MPSINVPVFVSSTWLDLMPEREAVKNAVLNMRGANFIGMERFGSRPETTQQASLDEVGRSEVYIGIFAGRYGSGITEDEYRHARKYRKPCFIYFKKDSAIPAEWREKNEEQTERLGKLKAELRSAHTVNEFADPSELARQVTADLHRWLFDKYLDRAEANAVISLHQLPPPPSDFTGREDELNELRALVKSGSVTISSLHGMGGVGKTALALKLADEFKDDYPDGQIYLDLKGVSRRSESGLRQEPLTSVAVMSHVIHAWYPEEKLPDRETELAGRYRSVLADKRALLLFDNARNAVQLTPLIPGNRQCLLLVTSRQRFALGGREPYDIDKLKPEDAVKLLRHNSSRLSEQDAKEMAEICDYLPMALKPAVSLLGKSRSLTPEKLIKKLRDKKQLLSLKDAERKDELLNISIEASFQLSYELLAEDEISDLPQRWRTLAVFPDTFDEAAAAAVWALDEDAAREALDALDSYSLIEIAKAADTEALRYGLHDLARDFADARLNDDERNSAQRRHARHYQRVLAKSNVLYKSGGDGIRQGLQLFDLEWTNIRTSLTWASSHAELDDEAAQLCINYPRVAFYTLNLRLSPRDRICWLEVWLNVARFLKDQRSESAVLGHLGSAWSQLGEARKAIEYHEQALTIAREIGDRRNEAIYLGNLGLVWLDLGEVRKAIEYDEQALVIAREVGDRRGEGTHLGSLGTAWENLGEVRKAIEYHEQALAISREIGDRQGEGSDLGGLGLAWLDLGEARKAIEYYEQALAISREIGDRRNEGNWLGSLGLAWAKLGDKDKALELMEASLKIFEEIESPNVDIFRHNLAVVQTQTK